MYTHAHNQLYAGPSHPVMHPQTNTTEIDKNFTMSANLAQVFKICHQQTAVSVKCSSGTSKFDRGLAQPLHANLHWLNVHDSIKYKLRDDELMSECYCSTVSDGTLSTSLADCIKTASSFGFQSSTHQPTFPSYRQSTHGGSGFTVNGLLMCNSLPKRLRDPSYGIPFSANYLKHLFSQSINMHSVH